MPSRPIHPGTNPCDLVLRYPTNWTAVIFFGSMGFLHMCIAIPAFWAGRMEGHLSLLLGAIFLTLAGGCWLLRSHLSLLKDRREVHLGTWLGRTWSRRVIPFQAIHAVRLILPSSAGDCRIELLCDDGDIECPLTPVPRQQALCMAMTMAIDLIKVCPDEPTVAQRLKRIVT